MGILLILTINSKLMATIFTFTIIRKVTKSAFHRYTIASTFRAFVTPLAKHGSACQIVEFEDQPQWQES